MTDHDPTDPDLLETAEAARQSRAVQELQGEDEDIRWLMDRPRGRRIVWWLMQESGAPGGDAFSTNALVMAHRTGRQAIGTKLFAMTQRICPERYQVMVKENSNERDGG